MSRNVFINLLAVYSEQRFLERRDQLEMQNDISDVFLVKTSNCPL